MKRGKSLYLIPLLLLSISAVAQTLQKTPLGVKTSLQSMDVEIQFYAANIVRVIKMPAGNILEKTSISVIKKPEAIKLNISQTDKDVVIKSELLSVSMDLNTGKIGFVSNRGTLLLTEKDHGAQFTPIKDAKKDTYLVRQAFLLDKDEVIYGLGQHLNGQLNQRNRKIHLRQDNMKVGIPYFQSTKGYGIFWDNYSPTTFIDNPQETSFDSEVGDCADYYFMYGDTGEGVISAMRSLTGQAPMLPLWVYGFSQSRERYKTQFELVNVVKKYRALQIPLDGIIQDWQYWGPDSNWNAMNFDAKTFPRPKQMVDSVHQLKAHLFVVAWPGFGPKTKQYGEYKSKNMLLNFDTWPPNSGTKPYDVYSPKARDIYWDYLNKGVFSLGVDAWWLDSSEPDHINMKEKDFDQPTHLGSFRSVRNAFPIQHVSGVHDHQRSLNTEKRVTILTRSAFAGQQRYGANTWSGDVNSTWEMLQAQIPAALNFSICGLPYWNSDIGGFFAGRYNRGGGAKNPEFQELYVRWMQFATFTPMMRSHGTDIPREIYQFGSRGEWAFDVQEKFINLRYSLLPYIYQMAWNVTNNSGSFIRALYLGFPNDDKVRLISDQYLFGQSLLVAPITKKGITARQIYLPKGANWYNFWTGEYSTGGISLNCKAPIDQIPLFVKAGSILPWGPKVQYAEEKKWDNLEIRIYPGADADFTLYEDENDSYNYEKGIYSKIHFHWDDQSRTLMINDRTGDFPGVMKSRKFNFVLMGKTSGQHPEKLSKVAKTVSYNGKRIMVKLLRA